MDASKYQINGMSAEKQQVVEELHRSARRYFTRRKTVMYGIADTYQIDLVEMIPYAKFNKNHKYILTVIDVFSKFAWALAVKTKSAKDVTRAMNKVFQAGHIPKNIHSDLGKEFYNKEFERLLKSHNINHFSTFSTMKASIVERFNRTLKTKMWKHFNLLGTYKWLNVLQSLVDEYNNTKHRTIKMTPNEVNKENEDRLLQTVYKYEKRLESNKFNIGDSVRISKYKHAFEKGYTPNWTTEIFKIACVQRTQPLTYLLNDYQNKKIEGAFYEQELQKVKNPNVYLIEKIIRKRGDKLFVKWLGFDSTHNSWISADDIK
jgi:hypothetical protein